MVAIYNDARFVYGVTTNYNPNTAINTNYITTTGTTTAGATVTPTFSWEGNKMANTPTAFEIAEALFVLKPKLRKKYKNCADALLNDIIAAADGKNSWNAAQKLGSVLGLED